MTRLVLAVLATAVLAAPAEARVFTIGSNLKAKATKVEADPVDSAYWNTSTAGRARIRAPRKGKVVAMKLKGRINPTGANPPDVVMHLQTLRPRKGGRVQVMLTTGDLRLPFGGDPQQIWSYDESDIVNLCVRKGDYVGLSTSGGYGPDGYPNGAEFQVFGRAAGSAYKAFTGAGRNLNGAVMKGRKRRGKELLMQIKIATGKAAGVCSL